MTTTNFSPILAQEFLRKYFFATEGASEQAAHTESLFMYIMWVNIISFVMLMAILGWFLLKYNRGRQKENYQVSVAHNTPLELTWSIVPLLVMVPIFYYGFTGYLAKVSAPADAEEIMITGKRWNWEITYRNGAQPRSPMVNISQIKPSPHFIVPKDRPVKLVMTSTDVIHAFYIPDFRTKMDVIPNRYTSMWFLPQKLGKHTVYCAEYCGQDHSEMAAQMEVVDQKEFETTIRQWTDYPGSISLLKVGEMAYTAKGCNACHTVNGGKNTGPTWLNMYGETHQYTDGSSQLVDENSLRENILYAQKRIMQGYPTSMPTYAGQLKEVEIRGLILYIKSLNPKTKGEAETQGATTVEQFKQESTNQPK